MVCRWTGIVRTIYQVQNVRSGSIHLMIYRTEESWNSNSTVLTIVPPVPLCCDSSSPSVDLPSKREADLSMICSCDVDTMPVLSTLVSTFPTGYIVISGKPKAALSFLWCWLLPVKGPLRLWVELSLFRLLKISLEARMSMLDESLAHVMANGSGDLTTSSRGIDTPMLSRTCPVD